MNHINHSNFCDMFENCKSKYRKLMAKAVIAHVQPTHFITLSLVQGRQIDGKHHGRTWLRGDDVIYSRAHEGFMGALSKLVTPRQNWKSHKPMLRSACVIEGGANGERNHLHILVAKPDSIDDETFRIMIHRTANGNPWVMNSDYAVDIQKFDSGNNGFSAALYSVKRGTDRISLT